jgi:carbon storage regulator
MLVLGRYKDEVICIGDDIEVTVVQGAGKNGQVRLGITAPREIQVDRKEVRERKEAEAAYATEAAYAAAPEADGLDPH